MKQFAYTYRIQYTDIISSLFFAALLFGVAVWSYLEKAGLHWKRVEIGYPDILYYTIGGGVALLVLALIFTMKMLRRKKLIATHGNKSNIQAKEETFSFLNEKFEMTELRYDTVYELWIKEGDDDDKIIVWYDNRKGGRKDYYFYKEFFANEKEYLEFHALLSEKCVNITNR